jgi:hypothetical protein
VNDDFITFQPYNRRKSQFLENVSVVFATFFSSKHLYYIFGEGDEEGGEDYRNVLKKLIFLSIIRLKGDKIIIHYINTVDRFTTNAIINPICIIKLQ